MQLEELDRVFSPEIAHSLSSGVTSSWVRRIPGRARSELTHKRYPATPEIHACSAAYVPNIDAHRPALLDSDISES